MSERTITFETPALLTPNYGPDSLTPEHASHACSFYNFSYVPEGYILIGKATITLTIVEEQQIVANKVESLKAEKQRLLAEAERKVTQIESQIQSLLALPCEGVKA